VIQNSILLDEVVQIVHSISSRLTRDKEDSMLANCPSCGTPMQPGSTYPQRLICPACGTTFLPRTELDTIADGLSDRIDLTPCGTIPGALPASSCPMCDKTMHKISLLHRQGWLINYCPDCDGFFLDPEETERLRRELPECPIGERIVNGLRFRSDIFMVTSTFNSVSYIRFTAFFPRAFQNGMRVYSEKWTEHLFTLIGFHGKSVIHTGDRAFDEHFLVTGRDPVAIKSILNEAVRSQLLSFLQNRCFIRPRPIIEMLDDRIHVVEGPVSMNTAYDFSTDPHGAVEALTSIIDAVVSTPTGGK
jgi:Zn-finger nucleic acid-binding protein